MKLRGKRCQCPKCLAYFSSVYAFDKHRIGEWRVRRCRTAAEMALAGMCLTAKQVWISSKWVIPPSVACVETAISVNQPSTAP
jgi:hypothetical protein